MEDGTRKEAGADQRLPQVAQLRDAATGDTMVLPDVPATHFEGEAELAVVIGKRGSNIKAADAMNYVFGYTNFIDGSARGLKPPGNTFYQMKSRDTFAPIGPYIVTADEIKDPHKLQVRLWNNGTLKQNFNTDDMAQQNPALHRVLSSIHGLEPGDMLATGTNHRGLHAFQDGDSVELEIEGLGRLRVDVRDDLKRTWPRDTRLEWETKGGKGGFAPQATGRYAPTPVARLNGSSGEGWHAYDPAARAAGSVQFSTPTIAPIRQVASVPDTIDLSPSDTMSSRRSGTIVAMPPIMMPSEPKLAKPHIA